MKPRRPTSRGATTCMRLAREKAQAVRARHRDLPVLAADTTVHVDGDILEKARNPRPTASAC